MSTNGNALVRKDGETPLFDGQGSERTVTNAVGAVQATLTLSAFGQAVASTGSSGDPYQYAATSRYRSDGDAGLSLVGCRYYDAQVGQFITRDTYLDQKPYAYCDADPVNALDPTGHFGQGAGVGIFIGAVVGIAIAVAVVSAPITLPILVVGGALGGAVGGAWGGVYDGEGPGGVATDALVGAGLGAVLATVVEQFLPEGPTRFVPPGGGQSPNEP